MIAYMASKQKKEMLHSPFKLTSVHGVEYETSHMI